MTESLAIQYFKLIPTEYSNIFIFIKVSKKKVSNNNDYVRFPNSNIKLWYQNTTFSNKKKCYLGRSIGCYFFAILSLANFEQFYDYKPLDLRISGLL